MAKAKDRKKFNKHLVSPKKLARPKLFIPVTILGSVVANIDDTGLASQLRIGKNGKVIQVD